MCAAVFRNSALSFENAWLDWTEIGRVWREEQCARTDGLNGGAGAGDLVVGQVIYDHHVAGRQSLGQQRLRIGGESVCVHCAFNILEPPRFSRRAFGSKVRRLYHLRLDQHGRRPPLRWAG